ncbi:hypothetical protein HID58_051067 [Brassica napus]|uniref:Uncharacterized protein n=1 Tax=Brassica napus TaxID=3708 RepID=A0ABQ8A8R8_BRANA|nr:hypothetical protein HID58_051067 [Brassica napus]
MIISSGMAPRFDDFVSSPFLSLFSHFVAPFIAARFSGGSFFVIFATPVISSPKFELLFFGGRLPFFLPQVCGVSLWSFGLLYLSFVVLRWHERLCMRLGECFFQLDVCSCDLGLVKIKNWLIRKRLSFSYHELIPKLVTFFVCCCISCMAFHKVGSKTLHCMFHNALLFK